MRLNNLSKPNHLQNCCSDAQLSCYHCNSLTLFINFKSVIIVASCWATLICSPYSTSLYTKDFAP
ncbi:MAG: hypothetical protein ACJAUP_001205 [Cellvibrionaceae bacterium]|jgi:hypothetical protein